MSEEARMKKTIIKIAVCVVVFIASAFIIFFVESRRGTWIVMTSQFL